MKSLNILMQSLRDTNYLKGVRVAVNGTNRYEPRLLKNGIKLREQLLTQLLNKSVEWTTQFGDIRKIDKYSVGNDQISFLQKIEVQKSLQNVCSEKLAVATNLVAWKVMLSNGLSDFVSKNNIFCGSNIKNAFVTDIFVAAEDELFRYNNLQRERKVWWMKYSSDPSRYSVEPCKISCENNEYSEIFTYSKSVSIKATYTHGSAEVENIYLIPFHKSPLFAYDFGKISLIRSVINLDLAASALILDSSVYRSDSQNFTLMLNRKLAPYQILLANLHDQNKTVDELTTHLEHVISRSGLRLYDNFVHASFQAELERILLHSDSVGIPYLLLIDNESTKSGLIRMRSRDTTLFETVHISDIPNYLINSFQNNSN